MEDLEKSYEENNIFSVLDKFEKDFNEKHDFSLFLLIKIFDTVNFENQKQFLQYLQKCICDYGYSQDTKSLKDFQDWKVDCYVANILWASLLKILNIPFTITYSESHLSLIAQLQDWNLYLLDFTPPYWLTYFKQLTKNHFWKPSNYNKIKKLSISNQPWILYTYMIDPNWKPINCDIYSQHWVLRFIFLNQYHNEFDWQKKIKYLEKILQLFPKDEEILSSLGYEFFKLKNYEKSLQYYLKIKDNNFDNYFNLWEVYFRLWNEKKSKFYFGKYLKYWTDRKLLKKAKTFFS